jgi:hypothetical protein
VGPLTPNIYGRISLFKYTCPILCPLVASLLADVPSQVGLTGFEHGLVLWSGVAVLSGFVG